MFDKNPLMDEEFLKRLHEDNAREVFARITALTKDELPVEEIQGKVCDGGNITIDGKSTVRRTCNLTLTAEDVNINEFYWGIKTKIKVEIGLTNLIEPSYPDIIWFPQGLFVLTAFSTTQTTNKWTIKITGKDKMCLLNGDLAGHLPHETDFGKEEYHNLETDTVTYTEVPVKNIIRNAVQEFGGELPQNIIINDLDDLGLELLEYRSTTPMYLFKSLESQEYKNMVMDSSIKCYYTLPKELSIERYNLIPAESSLRKKYQINETTYVYMGNDAERESYEGTIGDEFAIWYDNLQTDLDTIAEEVTEISFTLGGDKYILAKLVSGDMPGYFVTDLTYAGDLIAKVGETITSVLDKVKNMLTNFEYYYDVNGKFIFQKKKEYITMAWNNTDTTDTIQYLNTSVTNQSFMYSFIDGKLVTSFQNTPKINEIKNDYSIWGSYSNNGTEIPIHMRYAIDKKPISYQPIRPLKEEIKVTVKDADGLFLNSTTTYKYYDAPEIEPYDDACLLKKEPTATEGTEFIDNLSPSIVTVVDEDGKTYITERSLYFAKYPYTTEKTEYHNAVDWRELIYQMALDYRKCHNEDDFPYWVSQANPAMPSGRTGYEQYYIDFEGFWRTLYDPNPSLTYTKLEANEVANYTTLLDGSADNDTYDNVYIKNGLRPIEFNEYDKNTLKPSDLFLFDTQGLHDWQTSTWCHLNLSRPYFVREDKKMTMYRAGSSSDGAYDKLNSFALNEIYAKATEEFMVRTGNYIVYEDKEKTERGNFEVLGFPAGTDYELEEDDYFKVIDNKFDTFFEAWSNFNDCYIKDSGYVKLQDSDFFDYYYYSYYVIFRILAIEMQALFLEEIDNDLTAIEKYNTKLANYYDEIVAHNAKDIKSSYNLMKSDLIEWLKNSISALINKCKLYPINETYSFLLQKLRQISEILGQDEDLTAIFSKIAIICNDIKDESSFARNVINIRVYESEWEEKRAEVKEQVIKLCEESSGSSQLGLFMEKGKDGNRIIDLIDGMSREAYDEQIYRPCSLLKEFIDNNLILSSLRECYWGLSDYFGDLAFLIEKIENIINQYSSFSINAAWISTMDPTLLPEFFEIFNTGDEATVREYLDSTKGFQSKYYYNKYDNFGAKIDNERNEDTVEYYYGSSSYNQDGSIGNFWNKEINSRPQGLLFWVDFLEPSSSIMEKISVPVIGQRTKVVEDKNVKAVHYKDIPSVIFKRNNDNAETELKSGYTYININKNTENYFSISTKGKSANERLEELLYTNGYCPENITVQAIPVYHLEPNHHIYIQDLKSGIDGEYMVEKITIPLSYNKTMSITASKVVDSIT